MMCCSNWVVSPFPSYIELTGIVLKRQLSVGGFIEIDLMNVFMRRFQQLENAWARKYGDSPWRHYLEPDFMVRKILKLSTKPSSCRDEGV